ncbi:MAG: hypothetical protein C0417_07890 [Chlorobiaceae bacterium]|nr:hypothetical protein [Chlorobiaceae bacterium]
MKKLSSVILLIAIAILLTSIVLYAGDDKSVKKEATKCPMTDKQVISADKTAKSACAGMDASKSKDEKCAKACADKKAGAECKHDSQECKDKMAKGECKHDNQECKDKMAKGECKHDSQECKDKMAKGECKHDEMKKK